jgi:DNA-binding HxlR family transcriptional regulator
MTERGLTLAPVLQELYDWGDRMADEVGATIDSPA